MTLLVVGLLILSVVLLAVALLVRVRRAEIDIESTIIIPAGEAGIGAGQWCGMIRRSFPDDHLRR